MFVPAVAVGVAVGVAPAVAGPVGLDPAAWSPLTVVVVKRLTVLAPGRVGSLASAAHRQGQGDCDDRRGHLDPP